MDLIEAYLIRDHSGNVPPGISFKELFRIWVRPDPVEIVDNPLIAIKNHLRFNPNEDMIQLPSQLGTDNFPLGDQFYLDLSRYPMTDHFGDSIKQLLEWVNSDSPDNYFTLITNLSPSLFLNNVERAFYLTHGYGRPTWDLNISLRRLLLQATPTALITLSDILGFCPDRQSAVDIREKLNGVFVPPEYRQAISRISSASDESQLKLALASYGIGGSIKWDSDEKLFRTGLSQFGAYSQVNTHAVWDPDQVIGVNQVSVYRYLETLPDWELTSIQLKGRFYPIPDGPRTSKVKQIHHLLTDKSYFLVDKREIYYGSLVDKHYDIWPLADFVRIILTYRVLLDPNWRPISPDRVVGIFQVLGNPDLNRILEESQAIDSSQITPEEAKMMNLPLITWTDRLLNLNLWFLDGVWFPLNQTFKHCLNQTIPYREETLNKSIIYYQSSAGQ